MNIIKAKNIGCFAQKLLKGNGIFTVWGNTSRGVFLKIDPEGLIFVSYEMFKGPFTINIPKSSADRMRDLAPGDQVTCGLDHSLRFNQQDLRISMEGIEPWNPESFQSTVDENWLSENLNILAGWLKSNTPPGSFGSLSSSIVSGEGAVQNGTGVLHDKIRDIHWSISTSDKPQFVKSASKVVGLGSGLTPSGDDFLTGMSLTVARFSHIINNLKEYSTWFEPLSPLINAKTTILSSALFSASLQGSADERLIQAFDSIVSGNMVEEEIIPTISSWGSSSGFDALAGFYVLMKAIFS